MNTTASILVAIRQLVLSLVAAVLVATSSQSARAADAPADASYAIEYYYRVKWGQQKDFLRLYTKNHLPLLERHRKGGLILEMKTETPRFHAAENERWDYRVTIVWKDVAVATDDSSDAAILRELFPDHDRFEREERQRFEMLLAHWDVPVASVTHDREDGGN